MNTGQMIITMAAMILLSTVILSVNQNALTTTSSMVENKYQILGVSLGTALLEEAFGKAFDANTSVDPTSGNAKRVSNTSELTKYNALGPSANERRRQSFNDFDDYNNYVDSTSTTSIDSMVSMGIDVNLSTIFKVESKVYYVDPSASVLLNKVNKNTWHKRMDVFVTSKYLNNGLDTIKLSKVYSYFY